MPAGLVELRLGPPVPSAARIAVLRAGGLGDLVFVLPALDALRAAYPTSEILLLCAPVQAALLAGRPGPVDRVVVVPCTRGVREPASWEREEPAEVEAFLRGLPPIDVAVQCHGGGRHSNGFLARLGARVTAGLRTPDAPAPDRWTPYVYHQAEVLRFLEAVALLGAPPVGLEPRLAVTSDDQRAARSALAGLNGPVVVLHAGAGDPRRRWPARSFAQLGDRLAEAGAAVVVTGGETERLVVDEVVRAMRAPAGALVPSGMHELVGVLSAASVVVANDSGPRHLAGAVGTATVGIWWAANIVNAGPWTRRRHRVHVSWATTCPRCGGSRTRWPEGGCRHPGSWVEDVPVDAVAADALDLLDAEDTTPAAAVWDGSTPAAVTP